VCVGELVSILSLGGAAQDEVQIVGLTEGGEKTEPLKSLVISFVTREECSHNRGGATVAIGSVVRINMDR
jgi:hypothetical protein